MSKPTIHLQDTRWKKALYPYCKTIEQIVSVIPAKAGIQSLKKSKMDSRFRGNDIQLSIVLADDSFVRELNKNYRGKDKPTNVLSFPNEDEPLGDVILAYETIAREAEEQGKDFKHHAAHLIVHGILHLQGHDHEDEKEAAKMEAKEVKILTKLGVGNPYL